ncbi:hypothetical protein VOLCADRAFT_88090 [Volvox carteri f. nagariensis]|uniref:FAST kinase leucine-rich domain-containing protein n=1 Tax=Volvox carteri f. nagariensis TaxID=3068 RepID=D8TN18_VOLCA|nr:uncharacterized protein VOLCADRAFT_88090 [Volvox carteri f. nagariensis]EFJ51226.1 hypothetical protein VOLCADRAFT_88090 [Volvox carteri f. nagariensis]|eukprot:XP_002947693.1 hypothetical protein VOLCADRAFT_88090 [Volvox carteri f. nagariensis]
MTTATFTGGPTAAAAAAAAAASPPSAAAAAAAAAAAWQWLAAAAGDVLWSGHAREVAQLVWGFAAVGRLEPQVFGNLLTALAHPRRGPALVSGLREEECTTVLWAVATGLECHRDGAIRSVSLHASTSSPPVGTGFPGAGGGGGGGIDTATGTLDAVGPTPTLTPALCIGVDVGVGECKDALLSPPLSSLTPLPPPPAFPTPVPYTAAVGPPGVLSKALAHLGPRAAHLAMNGRLTGGQISSMLRSLVVIKEVSGVELDPAWIQALALRAGHKAPYMDGQALGNVAWALGKLMWACGRLQYVDEQLLEVAQLPPRADSPGSPPPPPSSFTRLCPSQMATLVSALGRVEHYDSDLIDELCGRVVEATGGGLSSLTRREVVSVVSALGRLEHVHPAFLAQVATRVADEAASYKPAELVVLLYGLASTGTGGKGLERLLRAVGRVLQRRISVLDPEAVVRLAESYAVLDSPHDGLFQAVAVVALCRPQRFSLRQMERVALAFSYRACARWKGFSYGM